MDHTPETDRLRIPRTAPERSLGELFRELTTDASRLIRQEAALARAEMKQNVGAVARDAGAVALWGSVAAVGALVLVAALVAFLGDVMGERYALAALLVGGVLTLVGGVLAYRALAAVRDDAVTPDHTIDSLRATGEWARDEARDLKAVLATGRAPAGDGRARPAPLALVAERERSAAGRSPREDRTERGDGSKGKPRQEDEGPLPLSEPLWKRVWHEFKADQVSAHAARVAYYFFLSLPPALMALFGLAGLFGGQGTADWMTDQLQQLLPGEAQTLIDQFVQQTVHQNSPGPFSIGLLLAIWAASNVMVGFQDTLNSAYDVRSERGFVKGRLVAIGVLLAVGVLFLAGSVALLGGGAIAGALRLGGAAETLWNVLTWPVAFALVVAAFWVVYYFLPDRDQSACKWVLLRASAIAAGLWLLATLAFKLYIANFSSYSETYGILGTIIVLLLWMYLTSLVVLTGGEIASELERKA